MIRPAISPRNGDRRFSKASHTRFRIAKLLAIGVTSCFATMLQAGDSAIAFDKPHLRSETVAAVEAREAMWGAPRVHYEVLSRPAGKREEPKPRTWAPEVVRPVRPYAYGWFGAADGKSSDRKAWHRQFGHQHSYVNYSQR